MVSTTAPKVPAPVEMPVSHDTLPGRPDTLLVGPPIPPLVRVGTFQPEEWEQFIQEWATSALQASYHTVMRCGGAGDMGRDVIAYVEPPSPTAAWDNYQCKRYAQPLRPSEVWVELGKVLYYTFRGEYTVPRKYYFVCPKDAGTTLCRLLERPERLRGELLANWEKHCQDGICSIAIPLSPDLQKHINAYPFDTFALKPVLKVIEEHRETPWHVYRFGGGLPPRPAPTDPPQEVASNEVPYVQELFRAYSDREQVEVDDSVLDRWPDFVRHLAISRRSFYSAESLREFSKDYLPPQEFRRLQDEICDGVQEAYLGSHLHAFARVLATTQAAVHLPITDHPLLPVLQPSDRRGVCHQLVNENEFVWLDR